MTTSATKNALILASAELVRNEIGPRFVAAFEAYANELKEDFIQAPPDQLQVSQGSARQANVILKLIKTSKEEADKILQAEQAKKQRS